MSTWKSPAMSRKAWSTCRWARMPPSALVGWVKHEAGWIDNVAATRLYEGDPSTDADDFVADNARLR